MSPLRKLALTLLFVVVAAAAGLAHSESFRRRASVSEGPDLAWLPSASSLRAASLGHPELMADLVFIRAITNFGTQVGSQKNYDWLPGHLETIFALDPYFRGAYRFAGFATMYNGRAITNESVRQSIHFLEMGTERFPSDWELAFMLGCDYLFELKTDDPSEKDRWRRIGGDWIRRAAIGGGPSWMPALAASIMSKEGETEAALRYLEEAYLTAPDERSREELGGLLAARRASSLESLQAAREQFMTGWKKTAPYAPADFYVLLGEPPSPRLDWRFLVRSSAVERALAAPPAPTTPPASTDGGAAHP